MAANYAIDSTDLAILEALQSDGRISVSELAEKVGLGVSSTRVRLQNLERSDVIVGYTARINPDALGYAIRAITQLNVQDKSPEDVAAVIDGITEVVRCSRVTGQSCYVIDIVATCMTDLERIVDQLCSLGRVTTDVVYRVMRDRQIPVRNGATR